MTIGIILWFPIRAIKTIECFSDKHTLDIRLQGTNINGENEASC